MCKVEGEGGPCGTGVILRLYIIMAGDIWNAVIGLDRRVHRDASLDGAGDGGVADGQNRADRGAGPIGKSVGIGLFRVHINASRTAARRR